MPLYYRVVKRVAFACLGGLAVFAGGLAAWSTIIWYKGRGPQDRKRVRKVVEIEAKEALVEQLA